MNWRDRTSRDRELTRDKISPNKKSNKNEKITFKDFLQYFGWIMFFSMLIIHLSYVYDAEKKISQLERDNKSSIIKLTKKLKNLANSNSVLRQKIRSFFEKRQAEQQR